MLDPHTDGHKKIDDEEAKQYDRNIINNKNNNNNNQDLAVITTNTLRNVKSTHTLLLYLTDCKYGGETLILENCCSNIKDDNNNNNNNIVSSVRPKRGRIFVFPHTTPHAGAKIQSIPKICLRAEVALY